MLPQGFLGTRADILVDIVVVSLAVILPLLGLALWWVQRGEYRRHRNLMVTLGATLAIVVTLFEIDIRLAGGFFVLAAESSYAGTALLTASVYIHLVLAVSTALLWAVLIVTSLRRFPSPPEPGEYSMSHKRLGRLGMVGMALTGVTGLELYLVGMVL